jgi:hypothetical protein
MEEGDTTLDYMPPLMGFYEEQYIPAHPDPQEQSSGWSPFYTCLCNCKRVFVWAYKYGDSCCVMVSDFTHDVGMGASITEIQHRFADQHRRQKRQRITRTHQIPCDPLLLQAFINEVTLGGNENMEIQR